MCRVQPFCPEQPRIDQVPPAPPPVALELVDEVGRHLFIASGQIVGNPYGPPGATHERGFDEVVGKYLAGQRTASGKAAQRAVAHERGDPDDRVVPPVMGFAELPEMQARGVHRTVDAARELLDSRIQRIAACGPRGGLYDARTGVGFHQPHEVLQALAAHYAVRVKHYHVAVICAPPPAEVRHVAAFALDPVFTPPVEDASESVDLVAQFEPAMYLGYSRIRIVAVTQYEKVELRELSRTSHRLIGGSQSGKNAPHILVADRHYNRSARLVK